MATTCDTYYPFDAGAGSNVLESQWRDMARHWLRSGPILGELNGFQVYADSTGMQVKVKTGKAWVAGHYVSNTTEKTLAIATYSVARFDLVILRADFTNNRVELDVLAGPGGATVASLTQNTSIWEIAIGLVLVDTGSTIAAGKVTDIRQFAAGQGSVGRVIAAGFPPSANSLGTAQDGDLSYEIDTNRLRVYEGSAWRWVGGKLVGAQAARSSTVTLTSGVWTMPALTESFDPDDIHAGTDGFVTIAEAGCYRVSGRATFSANSTGARGVGVHVASTSFSSGNPSDALVLLPASSGNTNNVSGSDEFNLAAGDKVSLCVFSNGTGSGLDCTSARLTVTLIGYRT